MKSYRSLIDEAPAKTIVFAFGRFSPPTTGHQLLVQVVRKHAQLNNADHLIVASRTVDKDKNPLAVDRKIHYLNMMFPGTTFLPATDNQRTLIEVAKHLNGQYRNLIVVAGSDRIPEYTKLFDKYNHTSTFNFDSIRVVSAGERDPDADGASGMSASKMRAAAKAGSFDLFQKGLPPTMRMLDKRQLMNDVRSGMGLEPIHEQVEFAVDATRDQYITGKLFAVGQPVATNEGIRWVTHRGPNYLTVADQHGTLSKKWLPDCTETTTELLSPIEQGLPMQYNDIRPVEEQLTTKTIRPTDKVKVARMIADMLGVGNAESIGPDVAVNTALRKIKTKRMTPEMTAIINKMVGLANEVGIKVDMSLVPGYVVPVAERAEDTPRDPLATTAADPHSTMIGLHHPGHVVGPVGHTMDHRPTMRKMKLRYRTDEDVASADFKINPETGRKFRAHRINFKNSGPNGAPTGQEIIRSQKPNKTEALLKKIGEQVDPDQPFDLSDQELEMLAGKVTEPDHILDVYDEDEFCIVDQDTGELVESVTNDALNEVLTRAERIKAAVRFARTETKRERKIQIALHTRSSSAKIGKRARRLAVNMLKQKIMHKPAAQLSVSEKERVERILANRKALIGRLAIKLAPRLRKIENDRMSHSAVTK